VMLTDAELQNLEDPTATAFDKWEVIQKMGESSENAFSEARAAAALIRLFEHESELVRHAALNLCCAHNESYSDGGEQSRQKVTR
jgi:hypothetical protein